MFDNRGETDIHVMFVGTHMLTQGIRLEYWYHSCLYGKQKTEESILVSWQLTSSKKANFPKCQTVKQLNLRILSKFTMWNSCLIACVCKCAFISKCLIRYNFLQNDKLCWWTELFSLCKSHSCVTCVGCPVMPEVSVIKTPLFVLAVRCVTSGQGGERYFRWELHCFLETNFLLTSKWRKACVSDVSENSGSLQSEYLESMT